MKRLLRNAANWISRLWQELRYGLWFTPTLLVAGAIGLAAGALELDVRFGPQFANASPYFLKVGVDGTRGLLEVVAGATISVASLTFSITVVTLSLAARQYTPRVIRTFMDNRPTQAALGVFVGIFVYCLIVLRSVQSQPTLFVPTFAATIAILLALLGVAMLVYFIYHVASSIQASSIISGVAAETVHAIRLCYPECLQPGEDEPQPHAPLSEGDWHPVPARHTGYLRTVDFDALAECGRKNCMTIRIDSRVGDFLIEGLPFAFTNVPADDQLTTEINDACPTGHFQTVREDIGVGIRQLVDIALRAGANSNQDTATVVLCIDYLAAVLAALIVRRCPSYCEIPGAVLPTRRFNDFLDAAFREIAERLRGNTDVHVRLLEILGILVGLAPNQERANALAAAIDHAYRHAKCRTDMPEQRWRIDEAAATAQRASTARR